MSNKANRYGASILSQEPDKRFSAAENVCMPACYFRPSTWRAKVPVIGRGIPLDYVVWRGVGLPHSVNRRVNIRLDGNLDHILIPFSGG
ncbi:hypothetical protein [Noviherbaspirillum sp.]|uniref:hypothetical protein n=1 Tax=Noviherbaspirillum sp. TaxID=1926288 RepID=UPI002FDF9164